MKLYWNTSQFADRMLNFSLLHYGVLLTKHVYNEIPYFDENYDEAIKLQYFNSLNFNLSLSEKEIQILANRKF